MDRDQNENQLKFVHAKQGELRKAGENKVPERTRKAQKPINSTLGCFGEKMVYFYPLFLPLLMIASEAKSKQHSEGFLSFSVSLHLQ